MKKKLITLLSLTGSMFTLQAQIGINTETPNATLDISAFANDTAKADGLIPPRLTGDQLKSKDNNYDAPQNGAIVYITAALAPTDTTAKTINVTRIGYYYFNGSVWLPLTDEPWNISGTTNSATSNTQNIYQIGKVGIGINPGTNPISTLRINSSTGNYGILNEFTNSTPGGSVIGIMNYMRDNSTSPASGNITGISSNASDFSPMPRGGSGASFAYSLIGAKNNGTLTINGLTSSVSVTAANGAISTGFMYGNMSTANATALSGNLTTSGALRAYSGYAIPAAAPGFTFSANTSNNDIVGGYFTARPTPTGGILNMYKMMGVSAQFDPRGSGTINISNYAAALESLTNFLDSSVKNINTLYGLYVKVQDNSTGAKTINNSYGIYIEPYRFTGDTEAKAYNLYSQGTTTKNYFEGKVGMGTNATSPTENLDIGSGNVRIRDINSNAGTATDKIVVADANGVLKTISPLVTNKVNSNPTNDKISIIASLAATTDSFPADKEAVVTFNSIPKISNTQILYHPETGVFSIKKNGYYQVSAFLDYVRTANSDEKTEGTVMAILRKNDIIVGGNSTEYGNKEGDIYLSFNTILYFNTGDTIKVTGSFANSFSFGSGSNVSIIYMGE